jgi:hypothetical protein
MGSHFQVWKMVQVGQVPFQSRKWFEISDGRAFSTSENGLDQKIILVMKMA